MCNRCDCAEKCALCVAREERAAKMKDRSAKPVERRSKEADSA